MRIKFCCPMSFDVLYADSQTQEPVAVHHTFEGEYEVDEIDLEEKRYGYTAFMISGDQERLQDGGIFEVPNPAFNVVKD